METSARQKQVLVINAAPMFREFLRERLSSENVAVEVADGRMDSFSKIIRVLPDLIIADSGDSFAELMDLLERKTSDLNARKIPVVVFGPAMERSQISPLVQYGVAKYFPKPMQFDVFFAAIGKILRANLSMDTTPCALEIHRDENIIFIEIANGLNREKISLLKYKIAEIIDAHKLKEPKLIVMMSGLALSFVDGINVELLLDALTADERVQRRGIKILSTDNFMAEFLDGHVEYIGVKMAKDLPDALGSLAKKNGADARSAEAMAERILSGESAVAAGTVGLRFASDGLLPGASDGSLLSVALVDDDEVVRKILSGAFAAIGVAADAFDSGAAFMQAAREKDYDLAVVDLFMQGVSGFDILERTRGRERQMPILIYSQAVQREFVVKALSLGAKGYLAKPQKPEVILKKAMELLNDRK